MLVYQRVIHSHPFPFQLCKCHHDPQPWTAHRFEIVGQESLIMSHVVRSLFAQLKIFSIIKWIKWHVTSTLLPNPVVLIKGETMWSQSVSKCCCVHLGLDMMRLQAPNYSWMVVTLKMALHGILWKWRRVIFRLIEFSSNCIYFPQPIQLSPINRWTWETPDPTWHT